MAVLNASMASLRQKQGPLYRCVIYGVVLVLVYDCRICADPACSLARIGAPFLQQCAGAAVRDGCDGMRLYLSLQSSVPYHC